MALKDKVEERLMTRHQAALMKRDAEGEPEGIVVACMDERNALTEEALGLAPHRVVRFASGGGRIGADDFVLTFGDRLTAMPDESRRVLLMTHEVEGRPEYGCAAFENDIEEQERYFRALRAELAIRLPGTSVHALCLDTSTLAVRPLDVDGGDRSELAERLRIGMPAQSPRPETEGHAGYGIYVGEAYRAWVTEGNDSFHVSACAPSLGGDLDIALKVVLHHSAAQPDRERPLVLHVDYAAGMPNGDRERLDRTVERFLSGPEAMRLSADGSLRHLRTETNVETWQGNLL